MKFFKSVYSRMIAMSMAMVLLTIGLGACSSSSHRSNYDAVCMDPVTQVRVNDSECGNGSNSHKWAYFAAGAAVAAIGYKLYKYKTSLPSNAQVYRGYVPQNGGKASFNKSYYNVPNAVSKYGANSNGYGVQPSKSSKLKSHAAKVKTKLKQAHASYKARRSSRH